jgi:hypothetical protein
MALICLVFLGLYQVSRLYAAREIMHHAAARGARAKTVGFRSWMVDKAVLVAAIPVAGRMVEPVFQNQDQYLRDQVDTLRPGELWDELLRARPASAQLNIELARIPEFMGCDDWSQARFILDYEHWNTIRPPPWQIVDPALTNTVIDVRVVHHYTNWVPGGIHRAFYAADYLDIMGDSSIENHFPLYIEPNPVYF